MQEQEEDAFRSAERRLFAEYGCAPKEHFVEVASPATRVRVLEVGEGRPVLFLHGSPNSGASWVGLAARLPRVRCLLLDLPGAGLSEPVAAWKDHRRDTVGVISAVLDDLGVERADLVGSSLGGLYAYNFALTCPERVTSLALLGCPSGPEVLPVPPFERILASPLPASWLLKAFRPTPALSRKMFADIGHGATIAAGGIPDAMFDWYLEVMRGTRTLRSCIEEVRVMESFFGRRAHARVSADELRTLTTPCLYLWGDADPMAKPAHGDALAALTPGARIEHFADAGHLPWLDEPRAVAEHLEALWAGRSSEAARAAG